MILAAFMVTGFLDRQRLRGGHAARPPGPLPPAGPADPADVRGDHDAGADRGRGLGGPVRGQRPAGQAGRDGGPGPDRSGTRRSPSAACSTAAGCTARCEIPDGLSLLLRLNPDGKVTGLNSVPPPTGRRWTIVHFAFDTMVGIGFALLALGAWLAWTWWRRRDLPRTRWFLRAVALSGVAAVVAMESGWVATEVGRQPWIVYDVLRTSSAVNPAPGLANGRLAGHRGLRGADRGHGVRAAAAGPQPPGADRAAGVRRPRAHGRLSRAGERSLEPGVRQESWS